MELEKLDILETSNDSESINDGDFNENILNVTARSINDDDLESSQSECSWESTEGNHPQMCNLVEYPPDVVAYGEAFTELTIEKHIKFDTPFKIVVFEVIPHFRFYFIIDEMRKTYKSKVEAMKEFYDALRSEDLRMAFTHIFPRQICAVPYLVDWGRGIIQSYLMGTTVRVFLVDFGIEVTLSPQAIKYLTTEFMDFPRMALRGQLAYIKPKPEANWISSDKKFFNSLMSCKSHMAKAIEVKKVGGKEVVHLEVYRQNMKSHISKLLVNKRFAEYKE